MYTGQLLHSSRTLLRVKPKVIIPKVSKS